MNILRIAIITKRTCSNNDWGNINGKLLPCGILSKWEKNIRDNSSNNKNTDVKTTIQKGFTIIK